MDFLVKKCIFLHFLCFSSGQEDQLVLRNNLFSVGVPYIYFECPYNSQSSMNMTWTMWPVGGQREILIKSGDRMVNSDFITQNRGSKKVSDLIILNTTVSLSTAGVYSCEQDTRKSAQFVVLVERVECYMNPKPYATQRLREVTSKSFSCTIKYVANSSYVFGNMSWSIRGSTSEPPRGTTETSTSANITEVRSTLNVTVPENITCYDLIYECNVKFGLKNNLPGGFVTNIPGENYSMDCSRFYDKPLCGMKPWPTTEKPKDKSEKKPDDKPDRKPDRKPDDKPDRKPDKKPYDKRNDTHPVDKSGEGNSSRSPRKFITIVPSSGGLAIKSSQVNDILKCVVGIAGFLLAATGIGV